MTVPPTPDRVNELAGKVRVIVESADDDYVWGPDAIEEAQNALSELAALAAETLGLRESEAEWQRRGDRAIKAEAAADQLADALDAGNALRLTVARALTVQAHGEVKMPREDWEAIIDAAMDWLRVVVYPGEVETEDDERLYRESKDRIARVLAAMASFRQTQEGKP